MASATADKARRFSVAPCSYAKTELLARELELPEPVAAVLVRRGIDTPEAAREFLAADERHDPAAFGGIDAAVTTIRAAIDAGRRITVHGDYDVDGTTATAILVRALRELGAECDWLIPGRVEDGYGLTEATIERLAERGTGLIVTVDCGITSVAEVEAAKRRGMEVVVTDHHQPEAKLPDCPIVHPLVGDYPCPDLCAAGVAYKLAGSLLGGGDGADRELDLVALATVADMVPLVGENRSLVRRGLELMRKRPRQGLRALMAVASVSPERIAAGDLSFRLAPRINAAGRLYRADAAVELFLCDDAERAGVIATELDRANHDRRETEADVLADASRALAALPEADREAPAIVLWGEGWHPGVVGICASRLAERHLKPAILIALDGEGRGKGSGRSVPGFDLLAGLGACSGHLARFGGHRAAAGLEIESDQLEAFRSAFARHACAEIGDEAPMRTDEIDAVVGGESLGHDVATALTRLAPFGKGNPEVRLLVPGARIESVRPMGEGERHARFSLASGGARASGVAFGVGKTLGEGQASRPVSLRLELNEWNGAVEPRVVLGATYEPEPPSEPSADPWRAGDERFFARLEAELGRGFAWPESEQGGDARERVDRRPASAIATVAALAATGEPLLVVCADALTRRALVERVVRPDVYGGGEGAIVAGRGCVDSGVEAAERIIGSGRGGVVLCDWAALALSPGLATRFTHVALADPAPHPSLEAIVANAGDDHSRLHLLASHDAGELTLAATRAMLPGRAELGAAFRSLRETAGADGAVAASELRAAFCGPGGSGRSPEACGRILRILGEIGVVRFRESGVADGAEVVSSARGELGSSMSFRGLDNAYEECTRFLNERKRQSSKPRPAIAA